MYVVSSRLLHTPVAIDNSTEIMMKRLLRSYVYNGFVWELNCSNSMMINLLSGEMLCNSDVTVVCYVSFSGREFDIID